jgi:iron(III) transport system permease protein
MTVALDRQRLAARRIRLDASRPVIAALAALLCVLVLLPIFWLVRFAFFDKDGTPTLANFATLATDPAFLDPVATTLEIAVAVAVGCCLVAAPLAWLVARSDLPLRRTIRALVMASFVTPPFLGAVAWEILAAPNSGILNSWARAAFGWEADEHLFDIYTMTGVAFVIASYTFPYVFVLVANALDRIPADLEDASSILGARGWRTARRITLPLVLPAILAGGMVAFLQAMTLFGSPAILALPAGFHTLTTKIWSFFQYPPKPGLAAAGALPLLLITVVLLRAQSWLLGRRSYAVVGGKGGAARLVRLGFWKIPALAFALAVLALPVFLPYGALLKAAVTTLPGEALTADNLTWRHLTFVFVDFSATKQALRNTFILGVLAATIGTVLAMAVAYFVARRAAWGHQVLGFLATAPMAIPGIVLGVGLFLSYTRPPLVLYGTLWILLIAFVTIELPGAYQQLRTAFRSINPELEEASRILGATRLQSLRTITAPLLRSGLVASWCFIFIGVMRELSAAILLFTSETKVVSVVIYDLNESGELGAISVLGLTLLVITFVVVGLANRLTGATSAALRPRG